MILNQSSYYFFPISSTRNHGIEHFEKKLTTDLKIPLSPLAIKCKNYIQAQSLRLPIINYHLLDTWIRNIVEEGKENLNTSKGKIDSSLETINSIKSQLHDIGVIIDLISEGNKLQISSSDPLSKPDSTFSSEGSEMHHH